MILAYEQKAIFWLGTSLLLFLAFILMLLNGTYE